MKVFVSGQIHEKGRIQAVYAELSRLGFSVTHDWTCTDELRPEDRRSAPARDRAASDIAGVLDADVYILMSDNVKAGKGMYAELGAALASAELRGAPEVLVVGPLNHHSIFYEHPLVKQFSSLLDCVEYLCSTVLRRTSSKRVGNGRMLAR